MKKALMSVLCVAVAAVAMASPRTPAEQARLNAIWSVIQLRMSDQVDIWFDAGDYPRATQALMFMAHADPSDYFSASNLGWMLENMDEYDQALACYIRFRKDNPNMADAPFLEAYFYFMRHAYAKIPPLLEPTLSSKPHPDSFRVLAHSYEKLGLLPDAQRVWKKLVSLHPDDETAKRSLRVVEKKLGSQRPSGR